MSKFIMIACGGAIGALCRYWVGTTVTNLTGGIPFPYGTMTANLLGCLLIGLLAGLDFTHKLFTLETRLLIFTGFLGAFTTFSTFSSETILLVQSERLLYASLYVISSVGLGLTAVWLGQRLATLF
ncbi:MAG: fluoride efflux transporter CrcB [Caldilineaceae bacterium]